MNTSVKSANRVLDILELFASSERPLALRDVASILGLPKSSTHMLLGTLEQRGYMVRVAGGGYSLPVVTDDSSGWIGGVAGRVFSAAQPVL